MNEKASTTRFSRHKARHGAVVEAWHNGGDIEIEFYARSLHEAAKKLIATLDPTPNPKTAWDAAPVILLYRQAVELQLKSLVGEGSFLKSPTDHITLAKTHSLRWLAQIVCQIIRAVKWEAEFKRESISSLADFSALVNELEELDPVAVAMRPGNRRPDFSVPQQLLPSNVVRFAKKLDALLDLLAATADGLAAEWDLQRDGISSEADLDAGDDFKPTIQ
jgi:hypothetical protein